VIAVAFNARLDAPVTGGGNARAHIESLANRARRAYGPLSREYAAAVAKIDATGANDMPDWPLALGYLWDWSDELLGRSGYGPDGKPLPLSNAELDAWARRRDVQMEPHEARALMRLDSAQRYPEGVLTDG
jgi:hypothetical protein